VPVRNLGTVRACFATSAPVCAPTSPPLRAASASDFAVDIEFAEPLDRASAENASHYRVYPLGDPAASVAIYSATRVDTSFGRVVQLLLSGGPLPDSSQYEVQASGVLTLDGHSTGERRAAFRTGLSYRSPLGELFADHCNRCHGAASVEGNYRTDSYTALKGNGTDQTANLIAGDSNCLLLRRSRPLRSMFDQGGLTYLDFEVLLNWVVSYGARP